MPSKNNKPIAYSLVIDLLFQHIRYNRYNHRSLYKHLRKSVLLGDLCSPLHLEDCMLVY